MVSHEGFRFDLRVVPPESYGSLLQHFTGSKDHNVALREEAVRRGLLGLRVRRARRRERGDASRRRPRRSSTSVLATRGSRRSCARTAASSRLPGTAACRELVSLADLQGDLHMHTDWSDGRAGARGDGARCASERGHRYMAICDHARRLRDGRLEAQAEEIAALTRASRDPGPLRHRGGHPGRRLARLPDEALAERDWVMASIHCGLRRAARAPDRAARSPPWTTRTSTASATRPAARSTGGRPTSSTSRRMLRARGRDGHLPGDQRAARPARPDRHACSRGRGGGRSLRHLDRRPPVHELDNLELAVAQARRGWVTPDQVVNTRSWRSVRPCSKA